MHVRRWMQERREGRKCEHKERRHAQKAFVTLKLQVPDAGGLKGPDFIHHCCRAERYFSSTPGEIKLPDNSEVSL
jgi:hypothetical protein